MKCFKRFALLRFLALLLSVVILGISSVGSYASTTTESGSSSNDDWQMTAYRFLELAFTGYAKEISAPFVIWNTLTDPYANAPASFENFQTWEHEHGLDIPLNEYFVKGTHGGGHSRDSQKINNSTEIDVPDEVAQEVLTYIQVCVNSNPLSYSQCYIPSYKFLNPSYFPNYNMYKAAADFIKQSDGYCVINGPRTNGVYNKLYITVVPRSGLDLGFVGTTTLGSFTNVHLYVNWLEFTNNNLRGYYTNKIINTNGTVSNGEFVTPSNASLKNTSTPDSSTFICNTNYDKDELVYVFDTLNAYKNYNSGLPQPYYLTPTGSQNSDWLVSNGIVNTGSMLNSGNYYSYIIDNSQPGMSPDEVYKLIQLLLDKIGDGTIGNGGGSSGSDSSGLWESIGNAIGNLIEGIVSVIAKAIEALTNAIDGVLDLLLGENGIISKLTGMVSGTFNSFLSSVFSWLPQEIVTLFTATLVFGIFFAIFKIIRR